jgi:hypothetical protein
VGVKIFILPVAAVAVLVAMGAARAGRDNVVTPAVKMARYKALAKFLCMVKPPIINILNIDLIML